MKAVGARFDIAVFPLLDAVLFPGVTLPLQVMDEKYRQMLRDVEAREWSLAVSLAVRNGTGELAFNSVCGAGRVQVLQEVLEGNSSNVFVHGEQRVRLLSIVQEDPYLVMEAETIPGAPERKTALGRPFEDFKELLKEWVFLNPNASSELIPVFDRFDSFGALCDFFAFHFVDKADEKQAFLDCFDPLHRAEMLEEMLGRDVERMQKKLMKAKKSCLHH